MTSGIYGGEAWEDIGVCLLARFTAISGSGLESPIAKEGNLITQADVSDISVSVFDSSKAQIGSTANPSASSTIFDTLQTELTWKNIKFGGNFRYVVPGSYFPSGGTTNRVEVVITLVDGTKISSVWNLHVQEMLST